MKQLIKSALEHLPYGERLISEYKSYLHRRKWENFNRDLQNKNPEDIFTDYYKRNIWGNPESLSGDGSTVEYTENIRKELPAIFEKLGVRSLLDAPCGDYNWFRFVPRSENIRYTGGDIVENLILRNKEKYENQNTTFIHLDIMKDSLPQVDFWLCRDVLFHFSNKDIFLTLNNFLKSRIPYLMTSSHTECQQNTDILTGSFRLLNLERPPFDFPPPILSVDDWIEGFPVRKLCLWDRQSLAKSILNNESYKNMIEHLES
jgi:SAM-dependent methyltransferase